jgi:hypothetical protein
MQFWSNTDIDFTITIKDDLINGQGFIIRDSNMAVLNCNNS